MSITEARRADYRDYLAESGHPPPRRPTGAGSRRKGASGEREFSLALHGLIGVRLARNLEQSRNGGHDLTVPPDATGPVADALGRLAFEIKRLASVTPASLAGWWDQAKGQAERVGLWPALAYRADRHPWRVRLPLACVRPDLFPLWAEAELTVDLPLPAFAALIREGAIADPTPA